MTDPMQPPAPPVPVREYGLWFPILVTIYFVVCALLALYSIGLLGFIVVR